MNHRNSKTTAAATIDEGKESHEQFMKRSQALPYISYKSLLATSRAVKHERVILQSGARKQVAHDLILYFAGDAADLKHYNMGQRSKRIRYATGKAAKVGMHLQMQNLRSAKTDAEFNKIQLALLTAIRDAQMGVKYQHVHECPVPDVAPECVECGGTGFLSDGLTAEYRCPFCKRTRESKCKWDWAGHSADPEDPTCSGCKTSIGEISNPTGSGFVRQVVHYGEVLAQ